MKAGFLSVITMTVLLLAGFTFAQISSTTQVTIDSDKKVVNPGDNFTISGTITPVGSYQYRAAVVAPPRVIVCDSGKQTTGNDGKFLLVCTAPSITDAQQKNISAANSRSAIPLRPGVVINDTTGKIIKQHGSVIIEIVKDKLGVKISAIRNRLNNFISQSQTFSKQLDTAISKAQQGNNTKLLTFLQSAKTQANNLIFKAQTLSTDIQKLGTDSMQNVTSVVESIRSLRSDMQLLRSGLNEIKIATQQDSGAKATVRVIKLDCDKFKGLSKDKCLLLKAEKMKNSAICNLISDKVAKANCVSVTSNVAKTQSVECGALSGVAADKCYLLLALKAKSTVLCDKIVNQQTRTICTKALPRIVQISTAPKVISCLDLAGNARDRCFYFLALETKKIDNCTKINDVKTKDTCIRRLASLASKPAIVTAAATKPAVSDTADCDKISSAPIKDSCIADIAVKLGNVTICNSITDVNRQSVCTAIVNRDVAACGSLTKGYNSCLYGVSLGKKSVDTCNKIVAYEGLRNVCIKQVSKLLSKAGV